MQSRSLQTGFSGTLSRVDLQIRTILQQVADLVAQLQARPPGSPAGGTVGQAPIPSGTSDGARADQPLLRLFPADYADGKSAMAGGDRPSARAISNAVMAQDGSRPNAKGLSDLFWQWGQFMDHDFSLVHTDNSQPAAIAVPAGDPRFDASGTGATTIPFNRSVGSPDAAGVRQQANSLTGLLDASMIYGSTAAQTEALRNLSGGRLATSEGQMMPVNGKGGFLAGDGRVNEQPGLAAMHNLWVREHNRVADELATRNPCWTDRQIFDKARQIVTAEVQHITYVEWLPELLGKNALPKYRGHDPSVNTQVTNEFAGAAFRLGHTMLSPTLLQLDADGRPIGNGLSLRDQFGNPSSIENGGMDTILRGMANQRAQEFDHLVIDDVRNFLFTGDNGGLDLVSLNIQRGRDHGLPSLNHAREQLGLPRITSFSDPAFRDGAGARLASIYSCPDEIDLFVGGLAEKPSGDGLAGPTFAAILVDQFTRSRDGNALWFECVLSGSELAQVKRTTLAEIIERNCTVEMQGQAFRVPDAQQPSDPSAPSTDSLSGPRLSRWQYYGMPLAGLPLASSTQDRIKESIGSIQSMPFSTDVKSLWRADRFDYRR